MESLVAIVILIFASVVVSGPMALTLASHKAHPAVVIPVSLFAIYVGWWWATTVIMPVAVIGAIPLVCGVAAIWKATTWD